ncbi:DHH family phosphoesterase, partial [Peptoniphilus genitalis]
MDGLLIFDKEQGITSHDLVYKVRRKLGIKKVGHTGTRLGLSLNREIATSLFTGLSTDTGSFKYSSVTSQTFEIASDLFKYNIDINEVTQNVYQSRSRQKTDLLIRA